ncbi:hypothetical protein SYNTR_0270 [Candidatus Syntrophocurvum alkaliphilum]|uniref:Uncharacterized protein n=1 Tax=Candidatus Syntrophocurvum alkaliphilum TaxID=2293317 RepID=A0A6I6D6L9_9FIRM|nr:hypothetical protein SYNTR_0270 [Candidatus Syntrophocurvum alkaliphilum]
MDLDKQVSYSLKFFVVAFGKNQNLIDKPCLVNSIDIFHLHN